MRDEFEKVDRSQNSRVSVRLPKIVMEVDQLVKIRIIHSNAHMETVVLINHRSAFLYACGWSVSLCTFSECNQIVCNPNFK